MARTGVTYLEVAQAASTLQHKGHNPTIDGVRRMLGTGSNTTIATFLKQWRSEHQPAAQALSKTTIPAELLSQIQALWEALQAKSQESIQTLKEQHAKQLSEHQAKLETLTQHNTELTGKHHQASQEIGTLQNQLQQSQTAHATVEKKLQQSSAKITELEARLTDKDTAIKDLKEQTQHIQQNLEHFREATQQQREELLLQQDNLQSELKQEIKTLNLKLSEERERHTQNRLEYEKQKHQADKFSDQNQWLQKQNNEQHERILELTRQLKVSQKQTGQLNEQCSLQAREITEQRQALEKSNHEKSDFKEKWIAAQAIQSEQTKIIECFSIKLYNERAKNESTSAEA